MLISVERRRRFIINERIKELRTLLPKQNEQYYDIVRDVRQNKGSILKASVDYIKILKREMERKTHIEEKCKMHEQLNRKLLIQLQVSFLILSIFIDTVRFLNLPIWANFVDPTDLSPYYYDHFRPNQFYNMDSTSTSTEPRSNG